MMLDIKKADHASPVFACATSGGSHTSSVITLSIAASSHAASRGHTANRMPSAAARSPAPVRYAQPCRHETRGDVGIEEMRQPDGRQRQHEQQARVADAIAAGEEFSAPVRKLR